LATTKISKIKKIAARASQENYYTCLAITPCFTDVMTNLSSDNTPNYAIIHVFRMVSSCEYIHDP